MLKRTLCGLLAMIVFATSASAGTMTLAGPTNYTEKVPRDIPSGTTTLNPNKSQGNKFGVQYLHSTDGKGGINVDDWSTAITDFNNNQAAGNWKLQFANDAIGGTLTINTYQAAKKSGDIYGAMLDLTFKLTDPNIKLDDIRWIQKINTNKPFDNKGNLPPKGTFKTDNYIDPRPGDDVKKGGDKEELPFYNTIKEDAGDKNAANQTYHFFDFSSRAFESGTNWSADLMLAVWQNVRNPDGSVKDRTVTVYDGIRWGWIMTPEPTGIMLFTCGSVVVGLLRVRRLSADRR